MTQSVSQDAISSVGTTSGPQHRREHLRVSLNNGWLWIALVLLALGTETKPSTPFWRFCRNPFAPVVVWHRNRCDRALFRLLIANFAKTEKEKPQHLSDPTATRTSLLECHKNCIWAPDKGSQHCKTFHTLISLTICESLEPNHYGVIINANTSHYGCIYITCWDTHHKVWGIVVYTAALTGPGLPLQKLVCCWVSS